MNNPFKKRLLSQEQREAAIEYVETAFGVVPKPANDEYMRIVDFLSGEMDKSDLSAWVGHLLTTPAGLFALARIKLGFGAPTTGLQWFGMQLFVDSCVILIDRGYPPAAAKIDGDPHYTLEECGQCKALTLVRSGALLKCNHCGHMQEVST